MVKYADKIDLYSDRGELIEADVPLEAISPIFNPVIRKIISSIKRTVAVNLAGIQKALEVGAVGGPGCIIPGRELKLDVVKDAGAICDKVKEILSVRPDDDTEVRPLKEGSYLLVKTPTLRLEAGVEYTTGLTSVAAAVTQSIIEIFNVDMFDAPMVKAAVWGRYPQTIDCLGANVASVLAVPHKNEGLGYALRNVPVAYAAIITKKNAMNAAALSAIFEQAAMFEMGDAIGTFERLHLLSLAYQGLNANNLVYDLVKESAKEGTVGTVVTSLLKKVVEKGVIRPLEKWESGYTCYTTDDVALWNAYAAAGLLAATLVNQGAVRAMQGCASVTTYFNDLLERETGLPAVDFGRSEGQGIEFQFFSHSIYGGGNPGIFAGNHIVTRHSKGVSIPPIAAAVALDAGTVYYAPERVAGIIGEIFSEIPELREPIVHIAKAAVEIKEKL